jgi:AraC-like DNA-binding protein/mannose-6-phosphate isomerase-like protein (cupin superfamily)
MTRARAQTRFLVSLYHTPDEASRAVFYSVVRAGHLLAGTDHRIERDHYPGQELIFCLRGRGTVKVRGREHGVEPGSLVWINCHRPHAYWSHPATPWELLWVRAEGPGLERIGGMLAVDRLPVITGLRTQEVVPVFQRLFARMQRSTTDAAAAIHADVARLIAAAFRARFRAGGLDSTRPPLPPGVAKAVQQMRLYYHQPWRLRQLAALAGLSESSFSRLFRATMGTSPIDWLRRERINQAKRRLGETTDSVKEIAAQVGYHDPYFFSKDFKRFTGLAPTQFRQREQGTA